MVLNVSKPSHYKGFYLFHESCFCSFWDLSVHLTISRFHIKWRYIAMIWPKHALAGASSSFHRVKARWPPINNSHSLTHLSANMTFQFTLRHLQFQSGSFAKGFLNVKNVPWPKTGRITWGYFVSAAALTWNAATSCGSIMCCKYAP